MSETVIHVENLSKTYTEGLLSRQRIDALRGVTFDVPQGEIFGLLGPNGAGKTTLIKVLLGIVRRSGGHARVLGEPAGSRRMRRHIGYLPENHRIPRHLTGHTALEYYGCLSGMTVRDVRQRRQNLLETVGLADWGRTSVRKYSKGMQQRLGLAQAMLHRPDLIVLDEPTDGVDPVGRREIREVLRKLATEGTTVFLNSHLLQEVELVCDRIVILAKGQVLRTAHVDELTTSSTQVRLQLAGDKDQIADVLVQAGHTDVPLQSENGHVTLTVAIAEQQELDALIDRLRAAGISIHAIDRLRSSLEDAFMGIIEKQVAP